MDDLKLQTASYDWEKDELHLRDRKAEQEAREYTRFLIEQDRIKQEEENKRKLDVHHVNYDKMVCCNEIKPLFVALCRSHNVMANNNRNYWQEHFTRIINEKYEGKCYIEKGDENQCPHTPSTRT